MKHISVGTWVNFLICTAWLCLRTFFDDVLFKIRFRQDKIAKLACCVLRTLLTFMGLYILCLEEITTESAGGYLRTALQVEIIIIF